VRARVRACVCVCVCVCACTYGRGSVLLWRLSDMLCTSGFMDDVIFAHKPRRRPAEAQCTRSLELSYKMCAVIPVADQRTHGTTFRALKVTSKVATQGAESAVYDCLVFTCSRCCTFVGDALSAGRPVRLCVVVAVGSMLPAARPHLPPRPLALPLPPAADDVMAGTCAVARQPAVTSPDRRRSGEDEAELVCR